MVDQNQGLLIKPTWLLIIHSNPKISTTWSVVSSTGSSWLAVVTGMLRFMMDQLANADESTV